MNKNNIYRDIIQGYIEAYNSFDITKMMSYMHDDIQFENISNEEINLRTKGINELRSQAILSKNIFNERKQTIVHIQYHENDSVEIDVDFMGVFAIDLPSGYKAGEVLHIKGKSLFIFRDDKIIVLKDIS
jgi:hypothetical protein